MQTVILLAITYGTGYTVFFCLSFFVRSKQANRLILQDGSLSHSPFLLFLHLAGIVVFGVLPFLAEHRATIPLFNSRPPIALAVTVLLLLLLLFLSLQLAAKTYREQHLATGQEMPSSSFLVLYIVLRVLFIVAYEGWFRGFFLADSVAFWGLVPAVCLNVTLYTILHIVNGKKEMLGCLPFGLLLCTLCLWQQAVWPAIALHLALTISYELSFLKKVKTNQLLHEHTYHRGRRLHRA